MKNVKKLLAIMAVIIPMASAYTYGDDFVRMVIVGTLGFASMMAGITYLIISSIYDD